MPIRADVRSARIAIHAGIASYQSRHNKAMAPANACSSDPAYAHPRHHGAAVSAAHAPRALAHDVAERATQFMPMNYGDRCTAHMIRRRPASATGATSVVRPRATAALWFAGRVLAWLVAGVIVHVAVVLAVYVLIRMPPDWAKPIAKFVHIHLGGRKWVNYREVWIIYYWSPESTLSSEVTGNYLHDAWHMANLSRPFPLLWEPRRENQQGLGFFEVPPASIVQQAMDRGWTAREVEENARLEWYAYGFPFRAVVDRVRSPFGANTNSPPAPVYVGVLSGAIPRAIRFFGWDLPIPTDILWPGFIANSIFWGLVLMAPGWLWRVARAARRVAGVGATRCRGCSYELGSLLATGVVARLDAGASKGSACVACPECGELFDPKPRGLERACLVVARSAVVAWRAISWFTRCVLVGPIVFAWRWSPEPGASVGLRALAWARTLAFAALGCVVAAWLAYAFAQRL